MSGPWETSVSEQLCLPVLAIFHSSLQSWGADLCGQHGGFPCPLAPDWVHVVVTLAGEKSGYLWLQSHPRVTVA